MQWISSFLILITWLSGPAAWADYGYIQDVQAEREERFYEIFLFAEPPPAQKPLQDVIFNPELSREFREKYRDHFGQLDTESIAYQRSDYDRLDQNKGNFREVEVENSQRRSFAEYMVKRLAEWHVDNYIKSEPTMRPVYEMKEKLKKVEVRVNKQTKLEVRYSLAGNTVDWILDNPYCDTKWTMQMDPGAVGPSSVQENRVNVGRQLTTRLRAENTLTDRDGRNRSELIRLHTARFSTSYGFSVAYRDTQTTGESRLLWALGYAF